MRLLLGFAMSALAMAGPPLTPGKSIPLPNVKGRIDHLSVDVAGQRLFVSALGNNSVEIIDLKAGKVAHSITGVKAPQGVLYVPESNRLVVASRDDGSIRFYDGTSYQLLKTVNKISDADNLRWDPRTKAVVAGYGDGAIGFFDVNGKQLGEVRLDGHPESFQLERNGSRMFVNTPTSTHVLIINVDSKSISRTISTTEYQGNYAMALDEKNSRLFIVPRKPPKVLVMEAASGRLVDDRRTVGDVDDIFYDAQRGRLYVIGGEGSVDVIRQVDRDRYQPLATIPTAPGARTGLFVPELGKLFIAVPHRDSQAPEVRVFDAAE